MRRIRYHAAAGEEAEHAADWYRNERLALGFDFEKELNGALALLGSDMIPSVPYPRIGRQHGIRRLVLRRFPYDLVFVERSEEILILALALAHHSRRPGYWRNRLHA